MIRLHRSAFAFLATLALAAPALAGPPALCHPLDIGSARSLPWSGASSWFDIKPDYHLGSLVGDTEAILVPATPVIVRMETLRRAAIYASTDQAVATELLQRLVARADRSKASGNPDALAFLDAAYLAEAYRELTLLGHSPEFHPRVDGVRAALGSANPTALIAETLKARPADPTVRFAAAIIAADNDRSAYQTHAALARAGASTDPLLARNIGHIS